MCISKSFRIFVPLLLVSLTAVQTCIPADFLVSSVADAGAGSLRQALLDANDNPGTDRIIFGIPGPGVRTLNPATPLPPVTDPVILDATTQPGYAGRPLIEINGSSAGVNAGLRILAGGSEVRGFCINRFGGDGVRIEGPGTNLLRGNFLGTDPSGLSIRGNGQEGVLVFSSSGNTIGGTNTSDGNVISGNGDAGVYLLGGSANVVTGNRIGTSVTGLSSIRNGNNGVTIYNSAGNIVGGEMQEAGNLLSGNLGSGVYIFGSGSWSNSLLGNYIGVNATASGMISNSADGVTVFNAPFNRIGGATPESGNVISANGGAGVFFNGPGARANLVQNNLIGCDATGTKALGNRLSGVSVLGSIGNVVGGNTLAARNIISGNRQDGVFCAPNSVGNLVQGNWIGVDATGAKALGNIMSGIAMDGARSNIVGGLEAPLGNLISGNGFHGVSFSNRSSGNVIQGNLIGVDQSGLVPVPNSLAGVRIDSDNNQVGGSEDGAGNLISGNRLDGIWIVGNLAFNNIVQGNVIGLSARGTNVLANGRAGIGISGAPANVIGGAQGSAGNTISGNSEAGIYLYLNGTAFTRVEGNKIGTDPSGMLALGNGWEGVYLHGAQSNWIGGTGPNSGNLISANKTYGMWLTNSSGNIIQGNWLGVSAGGMSNLGSVFHALELSAGSSNNIIGGDSMGSNRIAFAKGLYAGIRMRNGAFRNAILHNEIFSNGGLGIDLGAVGVLANDSCDADTGANMGQNYPEISQVLSSDPSGLSIRGNLRSAPGKSYMVRFYGSPECDPSGNGEGLVYLGRHLVSMGTSCVEHFVAAIPSNPPLGFFITATATDPDGNTSEFSECSPVVSVPPLMARHDKESNQLRISWTNWPSGFRLTQSADLRAPVEWTMVTNKVTLSAGVFSVALPASTGSMFYTLGLE